MKPEKLLEFRKVLSIEKGTVNLVRMKDSILYEFHQARLKLLSIWHFCFAVLFCNFELTRCCRRTIIMSNFKTKIKEGKCLIMVPGKNLSNVEPDFSVESTHNH